MYFKLQNSDRNISFWSRRKIIFTTVFLMLLISSGSCFIYFVVSLFSRPISIFPTSIPWINGESECKHANRIWRDGECWDYEHDMTF